MGKISTTRKIKLIVVGVSFGGLNALRAILPLLPKKFPVPIAVVQHVNANFSGSLGDHYNNICHVLIKEAEDKENLLPGVVYFSPPNYHLLVDDSMTLSLSVDEKVNFSRPSVDVLFESAAYAFGSGVAGVILTGANKDGSNGMKKIKEHGGLTIVQSPESAEAQAMPLGAIDAVISVDHILPLEEIGSLLVDLVLDTA